MAFLIHFIICLLKLSILLNFFWHLSQSCNESLWVFLCLLMLFWCFRILLHTGHFHWKFILFFSSFLHLTYPLKQCSYVTKASGLNNKTECLLQLPSRLNLLGFGGRHHNEKLTYRKLHSLALTLIEFSFSFTCGHTLPIRNLGTWCIFWGRYFHFWIINIKVISHKNLTWNILVKLSFQGLLCCEMTLL